VSAILSAIRAHLRVIFRRGTVDREMREEMALHLEHATERFMRRGLSETEARDAARREFGNVAVLHEEARDVRGARWIESCLADVRFALRHFARTPLTALTLVLVLALGIGVNSALFSILQALTMRPAPGVPDDAALVRVRGIVVSRADGRLQPRLFSGPEVNDLATRREAFSAVAAYARHEMVLDLNDGTDARPVAAHFVTPNYFATLGLRSIIGPGLPTTATDDAPGAELVVVIAHLLWEQAGADTAMIGRIVRLNGVPVRVVGVAPPKFRGAVLESGDPLLWVPLAARATLAGTTPRALASPDSVLLDVVARLAPNVDAERATALVRVVARAWVPDSLRSGERVTYASDVVPARGFTDVAADAGGVIVAGVLGTGALLVLLVACTNVSALLVGAAVARRREIAIRLSLGASRLRVVRQLLTETSLIALAGGALGLMLFWWIYRVFAWMVYDVGLGPDLGTVAFTTVVALGTGTVFGLSPALHATRLDVASALKSAGGGTARTRLQRAFIVAQIALTQPLLVGISLVNKVVMSEVNVVYRRDDALAPRIIRVQFGMEGGSGSLEAKRARIARLMDRVAEMAGVEAVVPEIAVIDPAIRAFRVHPNDRGAGPRAEETVRAMVNGTPPGYFAFHGIPMLRGRELVASDTMGRDMAIVIDARLARELWGAVDPIGRRLEVTSRQGERGSRTAVVAGVVSDTTREGLRDMAYVYTADSARWGKSSYLIRTRGPGNALVPDVRRLAQAMVPDLPIYQNGLATLEELSRMERRDVLRISATVAGGAVLALLLASIGLYGVVALAVRQRQREIGIRIALGARPRQVAATFFTTGVRLSALGIALGLPLSILAVSILVSSIASQPLTGISRGMLMTGAAIVVVVMGVASLASWVPARRAAWVDPLESIRAE
jgi:predicted permease